VIGSGLAASQDKGPLSRPFAFARPESVGLRQLFENGRILPAHHIACGDMSAVQSCNAARAASAYGRPASIGLRQLLQDCGFW